MDAADLDYARIATLERYLIQHIALAKAYRAEFGPESGLVKVNTTALMATLRKLKALRAGRDEEQWYTTFLTEAESDQAAAWARGENA